MQKAFLVVAVGLGLLIAYVDTRPNWDDAGVTAGAVFLICALIAAADPGRPWLWALAVGVWIPVFNVIQTQNYGALVALGVAFAGAYAGAGLRRMAAAA